MTRLLAAAALLVLPAAATAQPAPAVAVGPPIVAGRVVTAPPITNGPSALFPVEVAVPPRFSVGGGSMSAPPQVYVPSGAWSTLNYQWPEIPAIVEAAPAATPAKPGARPVGYVPLNAAAWPAPSGAPSATLVVEFPAASELWVSGQKQSRAVAAGPSVIDGVMLVGAGLKPADAATEWILTSPPLKPGESHTFEVRGQWAAGGKTYEAVRSVTVKAGDRSRVFVVSGAAAR